MDALNNQSQPVPLEDGSMLGRLGCLGRPGRPGRPGGDEHIERVCLRNLMASTNEAIYFKDRESRFILVSRGVVQHHLEHVQRLGAEGTALREPGHFIGKTDLDLFDEPLAREWLAEEHQIIETGVPVLNILERDTAGDSLGGWFCTSKLPLFDDDGTVIGTFGLSRDVTAQVTAEKERARSEAQLRAVLDSSPDAIACYNADLRYEMVNSTATSVLGQPLASIIGRTDAELGRPPDVVAGLQASIRQVFATGRMCEVEYSLEAGDQICWWHVRLVPQFGADGSVTGVVTAARDLTELKAAQRVLAHKALHDPLTGLANRVALMDRVNHAVASLQRQGGRVALLFIDLDHFKVINDAHGHDVGDEVLIDAAERLTRATRRADTVARLGGDEFVVLFDKLSSEGEALTLATRVLRSLSKCGTRRRDKLNLTASIGAVVTADPTATAGDLLRDADIAMYRAKENGRARIELFHPLLREAANERYRRARELATPRHRRAPRQLATGRSRRPLYSDQEPG